MNDFDLACMQKSINLTSKVSNNKLNVGIVIQLKDKSTITASSNNKSKSSWLNTIQAKLISANITQVLGIYLTVNTMSSSGEFDLNKLLNIVSSKSIYVGLPDPILNCYKSDDPVILINKINCYPEILQKMILEQNFLIYAKSKQNIKFNPYYSDVRISKLMLTNLELQGVHLNKKILEDNKSVTNLVNYIKSNTNMEISRVYKIVNNALSEAFNEKYSAYNYNNDARSIACNWVKDFKAIITNRLLYDFESMKIIDVGVGNGEEAIELFSDCKMVTFVDVAPMGLKKIKNFFPKSLTFQLRAEELNEIYNNTYDLYISLRTYNSSFFEIQLALAEAYRVLKKSGVIIISVANGFLCGNKKIIPGLIIPGMEFVDIYRGLNIAKNIMIECEKIGFESLEIFPTKTEIYVFGKAN